MSDNLYSRDLLDKQDIDLWRMSYARNEQNVSQRRRVEFDVQQRLGETSSSSSSLQTNRFNDPMVNQLTKDVFEPEVKIAIIVLNSVNRLTQHFLSHAFVVIRKQTQVNGKSSSYHLTPITVMAFIVGIQSKQGISVLWKGITSVFITKAIQIGFESMIAEMTPFVRDISSKRMTFETVVQHLLLKSVSILVVTPFLCSSCVEIVQSSIASENPGLFDSIKEGFLRLFLWKLDRKLPIWLLWGPTLSYHLSHYLISSFVAKVFILSKSESNFEDSENMNKWKNKYNDIISSFWGQLTADVILFPLSTVLMRLYLQGTRTIIDNVDKTSAVTPIISNYDSSTDCFLSIIKDEGRLGLFKGFGALVLQYSVHYSILRLSHYFLKKTISGLKNGKKF